MGKYAIVFLTLRFRTYIGKGELKVMDRIMLRGGQQGVTVVSNIFLDKYMVQANGEYVKVYLYLLRCLSESDRELSVGHLADVLENTESDIIRAIKYWAGQGLLTVAFNGREIKEIQVNSLYDAGNDVAEQLAAAAEQKEMVLSVENADIEKKRKDIDMDTLNELMTDGDVKMLLYVVQKYLEKTLNSTETNIILYIYSELGFSVELTEYLVEYCVSNNHKDIKYIEKVALNWHENNVSTVDDAKKLVSVNNFYPILKAFGIVGRTLGTKEIEWVAKWKNEYGFDMDIIINACSRSLERTHQQDFNYADAVLQSWLKKGVKSVADIKSVDEEYEKEKEREKKRTAARTAKKVSVAKPAFNNFHQRTYDYDAMEKLLLERK